MRKIKHSQEYAHQNVITSKERNACQHSDWRTKVHVHRYVDELNEVADEAHYDKANSHSAANLQELCKVSEVRMPARNLSPFCVGFVQRLMNCGMRRQPGRVRHTHRLHTCCPSRRNSCGISMNSRIFSDMLWATRATCQGVVKNASVQLIPDDLKAWHCWLRIISLVEQDYAYNTNE